MAEENNLENEFDDNLAADDVGLPEVINDELDEYNGGFGNTRTLIWNVEDLSNPTLQTTYTGPTPSIDHNNYVIGNYVYMSHYTSGLRILDISDINKSKLHDLCQYAVEKKTSGRCYGNDKDLYPEKDPDQPPGKQDSVKALFPFPLPSSRPLIIA